MALAATVPSSCVEYNDINTLSAEASTPTILGDSLKGNPYSVATMKQAATNLWATLLVLPQTPSMSG